MREMINRLKGDSFEYLNGWIWDRSRAVRVEINKNYRRREDTEAFLGCYEMCIRFHLLSMHQMAKSISKDYARETDWQQLSASCYQLTQLWDKIKVYVPEDGVTPSPLETSRVAEIHAYNIILGLKERDHREEVRRHPRVRTAQALVRAAHDTKNFPAFWRLVRSSQVSYLMACAAATRFNSVRTDTLEAMVKGYMVHKQKVDDWTLDKLIETLGFDDEDQVREFCAAYGGEFDINSQGITYLRPETVTMRKDPVGLKKQYFSQAYVECKRGGRNLAAVLFGYNLVKARSEGLLDGAFENDEDSLFVKDSPTRSNPFAAAAQTAKHSANLFPSSIQPGLFDASKNGVKFAMPPNNTTASATGNPFASAAAKLNGSGSATATATATGFPKSSTGFPVPATTSSTLSATANAFTPSAPSNPFGFLESSSSSGASAPAASKPTPSTVPATSSTQFKLPDFSNGIFSSATSSAPSNSFTGFTKPSAPLTGPSTASAGLSLPKSAESGTTTQPNEEEKRKAAEDERKKAEEAQRIARQEEERKAQEERQRAAEAQRRQAEEEQRRKVQEEQAKARAAEHQRRIREEKERERVRAEQEAARQAQEQRRQAFETLTMNLLEDPHQGLMKQYISNMVDNLVQETKAALRKERQAQDDAQADEMWQRKRLNLARLAFYKWAQHVQKKRRLAEARNLRERRRKLKAEIQAAKSSAASSAASPPAPEVQAGPEVPVDRPVVSRINGASNRISKITRAQKPVQKSSRPAPVDLQASNQPSSGFSKSYCKARAQYVGEQAVVDRTETDYFKLRAQGIDPYKLRKRSLDSSDEENAPKIDNKRPRHSIASITQGTANLRKSLPPPTTDEERMARFRAIKESLNRSGHTPSRSVDFSRTFNGATSQIIQRARETLAQTPSSRQSTPDAAFARSTGTPLSSDKPAYWARQSRFVPQHLYGQPEAIRAYRAQVSGRSPTSSHIQSQASPDVFAQKKDIPDPPNFLSSPMQTQQLYRPSQQLQTFEIEDTVVEVQDDADGEDEEEGEGELEYDEYGEEDEEVEEEDEGEFYSEDEDDEEGYSEEEEEEVEDEQDDTQYAQKPGATEDDAIELSD